MMLLQWGRRILIAVSALLCLNAVILYFFIADSALMRTTSLLELGVGMLALAAAWAGLRDQSDWASLAMWGLVVTLLLVGAHILISGDMGVGIFYLALATIALAGQLLTRSARG